MLKFLGSFFLCLAFVHFVAAVIVKNKEDRDAKR